MYSIQPSQTGKLARFLKNPENKTIGINKSGTTADIDLASKTTLPINNPKDDPHKPIKINIKQCKKNCPAVGARLIIKQ